MDLILDIDSFYIETYGCASNKADSYLIANVLKNSNYIQTTIDKAQYIIINTCAVKEQTENKIKARLKQLYDLHGTNPQKHIIVAGCLPHIAPNYIDVIKKIIPTISAIMDLDNIHELPKILAQIKKGNRNLILKSKERIDKAKFFINPPKEKITGIIPISEGCQGTCTYCCVKNARGPLICYDPVNIVKNVANQLSSGIKQIYLTSQDCSIYQYKNTNLFDVIKKVVDLPYKFYLRIGMLNPSFLISNLNQLISIYEMEKVYNFLHIPIQSGSDEILKLMQRTYLIQEIIDKIDLLRERFPRLTISTDIICGFPWETEYDFLKTINLIKWLKPEILNISKFTARPGTKAKEMQQLDSRIIKERSIRLSTLFRNIQSNINKKWMNWEGEVLILQEITENNQAFARNLYYKNILINDCEKKKGDYTQIRITKIQGANLYGEIVK